MARVKREKMNREQQKQYRELLAEQIWFEYSVHKLKEEELATKFHCSPATVSKVLTDKLRKK